jgi:hypothetical protein
MNNSLVRTSDEWNVDNGWKNHLEIMDLMTIPLIDLDEVNVHYG